MLVEATRPQAQELALALALPGMVTMSQALLPVLCRLRFPLHHSKTHHRTRNDSWLLPSLLANSAPHRSSTIR